EFGSYDLTSVLRTMTKSTSLATTSKQAIHGLQHAIKHAVSDRKGPTGLVIYQPEVYEEYDDTTPPYVYDLDKYIIDEKTVPPTSTINKAIELVSNSKLPVIIAGNGIHMSESYDELEKFASEIGAPVVTSYRGKSAIRE